MEEAFKAKLKENRRSVNLNSVCFPKQRYDEVIKKVIKMKLKMKNKHPADYKLLKKYDVVESEGIQRLIVPSKESESNIIYYVHDDELFRVLMEAHLSLDHGGRDKMMKVLKKTYKNITYKDIMIFLYLCKHCLKKHKREMNIGENGLNSKCQINFVDFRTHPDGEFNFILIYFELSTKFCLLKPLTSKSTEEVADQLIDVFTMLGSPSQLQSDQEPHFIKSLIDTLKTRWVELQITYVKSKEPLERIDQEIENMIRTWMRNNITSRWSEGLRFVQLEKNTTFHPAVNKSPYEALFKRPLNFDLPSKKVNLTKIEQTSEGITQTEIMLKSEHLDEEYEQECDEQTEQEIEEEKITICKSELYEDDFGNICEICGNDAQDKICNLCK